jgi:hypothetical protein
LKKEELGQWAMVPTFRSVPKEETLDWGDHGIGVTN